MALTNAERQRKYREKRDNDAARRAEYLRKKQEKYLQDLASGKRQLVSDLTYRSQRYQRKQWREQQKRHRENIKNAPVILSPPHTPEPGPSHQQISSSKRRERSRAKCYRDNEKLKKELEIEKKKASKYMRRWLREVEKQKEKVETPRTKTKRILRGLQINIKTNEVKKRKQNVKRTLLFHFAMNEALKQKYKGSSNKFKKSLSEIATASVLRKYRLTKKTRKCMGMQNTATKRQQNLLTKRRRLDQDIHSFFERDENSRMTPGIKQTITVRKMKKQKRLLTASLQELYNKYIIETKEKISYSSFCRRKPFWVIAPKESDRETCACELHENTQLMADALHKRDIIDTSSLHLLVQRVSCDAENMMCMYSKCSKCSEINMSCLREGIKVDHNEVVTWKQWVTKREEKLVRGEKKTVVITAKEEIRGALGDLIEGFIDQMVRYKQHSFNIWNQLTHYREQKENLKQNEGFIHIDFAENYQTKLGKEIQSMHFGASHAQITLHTGISYNGKDSRVKSFCTVSESMDHSPAAVWAYLNPVLDEMQRENESLETVHIYSDGPATQYKQ